MRIEVVGDETISAQARTYAEYRVFAALTGLAAADEVRSARVELRRTRRSNGCDAVTCRVTVGLNGSDSIRARITADHAYAAINDAVDRIRASRPARALAAAAGNAG